MIKKRINMVGEKNYTKNVEGRYTTDAGNEIRRIF